MLARAAATTVIAVAAAAAVASGSPSPLSSAPAAAPPAPSSLTRRVVIDPGHGGSNPGALGASGVHVKQLPRAIAGQVQQRLLARGIDARLTRTHDVTMTLRQRVAIANQLPADLFISIHGNASPTRTQRGYETYVLTPRGVDIDARALRSDTTTPRPGLDAATALILDDVERGAAQWEAADLAADLQARLRTVWGPTGDRGVRQDSQHVLLGATMPAVLVEVGFVDHPIEGRELLTPARQAAIADAIADALTAALDAR
ncbi:MAG: N-acetylmuramoyl-L-alanine amidase [Kofleriaceae bacterium]